jgi:hypothetical protein
LASSGHLLVLAWLLRRRLAGPGGAPLWWSLARTLGASAALAAWCLALSGLLPGVPAPAGRGVVWMIVTLVGGVAVYAAGAGALRSEELGSLLGMLRRRGGTLPPPARR